MAVFINGGENRKIPSPFDCLNYGRTVIYYQVHSLEKANGEWTFSDSMTPVEGSSFVFAKTSSSLCQSIYHSNEKLWLGSKLFSDQQRREMKQKNLSSTALAGIAFKTNKGERWKKFSCNQKLTFSIQLGKLAKLLSSSRNKQHIASSSFDSMPFCACFPNKSIIPLKMKGNCLEKHIPSFSFR